MQWRDLKATAGLRWVLSGSVRVATAEASKLKRGVAYLRMQLAATAIGLGVHPMSQALQEFAEMKPFYDKAHQLMLGKLAPQTSSDETLQMFCRLGYVAGGIPATPRRQIDKFILTT